MVLIVVSVLITFTVLLAVLVHLFCRCAQEKECKNKLAVQGQKTVIMETPLTDLTHTRQELLHSDLSPGVVSVGGVLLPRLTREAGECGMNNEVKGIFLVSFSNWKKEKLVEKYIFV